MDDRRPFGMSALKNANGLISATPRWRADALSLPQVAFGRDHLRMLWRASRSSHPALSIFVWPLARHMPWGSG